MLTHPPTHTQTSLIHNSCTPVCNGGGDEEWDLQTQSLTDVYNCQDVSVSHKLIECSIWYTIICTEHVELSALFKHLVLQL